MAQSSNQQNLLSVCIRDPRNELVAAECENLTGGRPDEYGVAFCETLDYIRRAVYIRYGVRLLAAGETPDLLIENIKNTTFDATDFRIEWLRLSKHVPLQKLDVIPSVADAMPHYPNLRAPTHRFLLMVRGDGFRFGEILAEPDHSYRKHDAKPHHTSSGLPAELARAVVNLVSPPAQTLLDPCCGTGSILLEASAVGLTACGSDKNPRMAGQAIRNLRHFGYPARIEPTDARACVRTADALVTNLPYGDKLEMSETTLRDVLRQTVRLAPVAVYVASRDISARLTEAGYRHIEVFRVPKYTGFMRYVHRAKR